MWDVVMGGNSPKEKKEGEEMADDLLKRNYNYSMGHS